MEQDHGFISNAPIVSNNSVAAVAAHAREQHEIQAAIVSAKKFPRNEYDCVQKILLSFEREGLAEDALYSFPRSGTNITGPSVQCAREVARCWGNIRYGVRWVELGDDQVHIKGYAYDLESNVLIEAEDRFRPKIQRKNKQTGVTSWIDADERELRELVNRRGAILVRNCILQIVPPDVLERAVKTAKGTIQKKAANQLAANRADVIRSVVSAFHDLGVTIPMLEKYLGHDVALISQDQLVELGAIGKSIKDGNSKRDEHFELSRSRGADELNAAPKNAIDEDDIGVDI